MIVVIAGTFDEAQRHAAIQGLDRGRWVFAVSRMAIRALEITRVDLVGSYARVPGWQKLFEYAQSRIGEAL